MMTRMLGFVSCASAWEANCVDPRTKHVASAKNFGSFGYSNIPRVPLSRGASGNLSVSISSLLAPGQKLLAAVLPSKLETLPSPAMQIRQNDSIGAGQFCGAAFPRAFRRRDGDRPLRSGRPGKI